MTDGTSMEDDLSIDPPMDDPRPASGSLDKGRLAKVSTIVALGTLTSRLTGLLRVVFTAAALGDGIAADGTSGATVATALGVRLTGPATARLQTADSVQIERAARLTAAVTSVGPLMCLPLAILGKGCRTLKGRQATHSGALRAIYRRGIGRICGTRRGCDRQRPHCEDRRDRSEPIPKHGQLLSPLMRVRTGVSPGGASRRSSTIAAVQDRCSVPCPWPVFAL